MEREKLDKLQRLIKESQNIILIPHKNPDGDAIGSCLALNQILKKLRKKSVVISPNEYAGFLHWLPGSDDVMIYENKKSICDDFIDSADLIFTLDFNSLKRIDVMEKKISGSVGKIIMIDHHQDPENYADLMLSFPNISSTCEIVYEVIEGINQVEKLDEDISSCLYTGIFTDTGSFRFSSVTPRTHIIVSKLLEKGAKSDFIQNKIKDQNGPERLKLLGIALKNIIINQKLKTCITTLNQKELEQCNYKKGDYEGFVNYGLSIKNIELSIILIEEKKESQIKMSFRSKGNITVNDFAKKYFNGGGHKNAAGGISKDSLKKTIELVNKHLESFLKNS